MAAETQKEIQLEIAHVFVHRYGWLLEAFH